MRRLATRLLLAAFFASPAAADWSRFRGPNGSGAADGTLPAVWGKKDGVLWAVDLPGKGNSSPILVGGKLLLQSASGDGSKRSVVCLDPTTGKTLWTLPFGGEPAKTHAKSSLASSTPSSDGERAYATVWDGRAVSLHAVTLSGKEAWRASLGSFRSQHGAGMSPVVHGGKVFVNFDQDDAAEVVAFDAKTGEKAWSHKRKAFRASYATPVVREVGGKTELVVFSTAGVTGYDPDKGTVLWNWDIPWKAGEMALRAVASPLLVGDMIVLLTGDGSGTRYAACVTPAGDTMKVHWEKRSNKLAPYVPCPVAKGGYVYWVTDQGIAECVEASTGKVAWSERVVNGSVSASPVLVGDRIVILDERGKAVVVRADPAAFEKLGDADLGEAIFASPAAADGKLYVRTGAKLYCFGAK